MSKLTTIVFSTILFFTFTTSIQAQLAFADYSSTEIIIQTDEDLTEKVFFTDAENNLFFIDFEVLDETPLELTIRQDAQVVLQEDVADLPTNTIYEVDMKLLQVNKPYTLEIKTEIGILTKEFKLTIASR